MDDRERLEDQIQWYGAENIDYLLLSTAIQVIWVNVHEHSSRVLLKANYLVFKASFALRDA